MLEETPFTPQEIDEQIDHFSQGLRLPPGVLPGQQLVEDLHTLYAAESSELSQAVARGRERLARNNAVVPSPAQNRSLASQLRIVSERQQNMQNLKTRFSGEHKLLYRIGSLVAAVLLVALIGGLIAGLILVRQGRGSNTGDQPTPDLRGGTEIVLQATCSLPPGHCSAEELALLPTEINLLQKRINGLGLSPSSVRQQGSDQIVIDLPHQANPQSTVAFLTQTGKLAFIDTGPSALTVGTVVQPGQYLVRFTGEQLDPNSIAASTDPLSGRPIITFEFRPSYRADFATYTRQNIGNYLTITLDNKVIESAVIQSEITGPGQISGGNMTPDSAHQIATLMRYGSLPLPLTVISQHPISG